MITQRRYQMEVSDLSKTKVKDFPLISVVIPTYNESQNVPLIFAALKTEFSSLNYKYEIIFVNDGSTDGTIGEIENLAKLYPEIRYVDFSRNFGKEAATTAGLHAALGDAVIIIDADMQHPPKLIHTFLTKWRDGHEVVIAIRTKSKSDRALKRLGSALFYKIMSVISETEITPHATDFRLLSRNVVDAFNNLTEHNRMTRGLIDWLGFKRTTVEFDAGERLRGDASYSVTKLVKLATESFIAHSLFPLRLTGYLGVFITILALCLGTFMFLDRYFLMMGYNFSGPAMLAVMLLFLVGIVLIGEGLLAYYIAQIHRESQNRPLYVARK